MAPGGCLKSNKLLSDPDDFDRFTQELGQMSSGLPQRINANPEEVERGLAQLVLTLIELLRQLMERQALRRVESNTLSDAEIEKLGMTFLKLEERMAELKEIFGLTDEDLNIDLGPLGRLM